MKKIVYIIVMIVLALVTIAEGFIIYSQYTIIKKNKGGKEVYVNYDPEFVKQLVEALELERKGLRHDSRGGDFCPACEGKNVVRIVYGLNPKISKKDIEEGRVIRGGCLVSEYSKIFVCRDCTYKWGSRDIFMKNDTTNTKRASQAL